MNKTSSFTKGILETVAGGILWGISGTCGQFLFDRYQVSTLWFTCIRELSAGLLLLLYCFARRDTGLRRIWQDRSGVMQLLCYSLIGLVLCQYSYMTTIAYSDAGTGTVLQNLSAVIIMAVSCITAKRFPSLRETIALILALAGVWLICTAGDPGAFNISPLALFWGGTAAVAVACYTLIPQRINRVYGTASCMAWGMLIGGIFLLLVFRIWRYYVPMNIHGWMLLVYMVLFGTALPFLLFMNGVRDIGPVRSIMLGTTEPLTAALFAWALLGTHFSVPTLIGFVFILLTVLILAKPEPAAEKDKL